MSSVRARWIACVAVLPLIGGCASLPVPPRWPELGAAVERDGPMIRPDAPAEYDLLVAQLLMSEGRAADALEAFLRAVEKDPDSAFLQHRAAASLAQNNRIDEALEHAEAGLALDGSNDQAPRRAGAL